MKLQAIIDKGQGHLVKHYQSLNYADQQRFMNSLEAVDYDLINSLYQQLVREQKQFILQGEIKPIKPYRPDNVSATDYRKIGLDAIKSGRVAVLLLAGGQGSRLGHDGPKGTYNIDVKGAGSLFEIQANYLKCLYQKTGVYLPWYIMTSALNHQQTVEFFEQHHHFNYPTEQITFFAQGMIEAVDSNGKIIIDTHTSISRSPDGNGGCFKALKDHGIVKQLRQDGYEWLFIYNVDNAIVNIADPLFIGYTIASGLPCGAKVVPKSTPQEKVGVPCTVGGKPTIVEYSELNEQQLNATDNEGNLVFSGGNIGNYLVSLQALDNFLDEPLAYHLAHKKIAYLDKNGKTVKPEQPNGYKFELFIFDIFPAFSGMAVYQVQRDEEFAPVKNASGVDSPQTARELYTAKYKRKNGEMCV